MVDKSTYWANPEKNKRRSAQYRIDHPDKIKSMSRRYYELNRDEIHRRDKERSTKLRLETVAAYGGKCLCCGEAEPKFLCIDHINGDGKIDRQAGYFGVYLFAKLKKEGWPKDRYRLLCHNCNEALRIIGSCPHGGI